jgi:hypothetical protein
MKKYVVGPLPYWNVPMAHLDAHHVVVEERQHTSLVIAEQHHDDAMETV